MANPFEDTGHEKHKILKRRFFKVGYEVRYIEVRLGKESPVVLPSAFNTRGEYIGNPRTAGRLFQHGILPELIDTEAKTCSIGYCSHDGKWHGWSHRAKYGFGIGSRVKKGDCAYITADADELIAELKEQFSEGKYYRSIQFTPFVDCVQLTFEESMQPMRTIKRGKRKGECVPYGPVVWESRSMDYKLGHGEWTAKTIGDAREMAIAFARSVS